MTPVIIEYYLPGRVPQLRQLWQLSFVCKCRVQSPFEARLYRLRRYGVTAI